MTAPQSETIGKFFRMAPVEAIPRSSNMRVTKEPDGTAWLISELASYRFREPGMFPALAFRTPGGRFVIFRSRSGAQSRHRRKVRNVISNQFRQRGTETIDHPAPMWVRSADYGVIAVYPFEEIPPVFRYGPLEGQPVTSPTLEQFRGYIND